MPTRAAKYLLAPMFLAQAPGLRRKAGCLPEPRGPRAGQNGPKGAPILRMLIAGDSSALGLGAPHQDQALSGQILSHLTCNWQVDWVLSAKSGDTTAMTVERLRKLEAGPFDIAVTSLGVNDLKNGVPRRIFLRNQAELFDLLGDKFSADRLYVSGFPPVHDFPLLPPTMAFVLGKEAKRFDAGLRALCARTPGATLIPGAETLLPEHMSADGFHPGPPVYKSWAAEIAKAILADLNEKGPAAKQGLSSMSA